VNYKMVLAATALAGMMAACQSSDITVAEYCANPDKASENICQLNLEINGTRTALADTDLRLSEARSMASNAMSTAEGAMTAAKGAQATADDARAMASTALSSIDDLKCETLTINQTDTGSCPANYRLMSCSQTRFTTRSGGLSFLREIDDQKCRFNARVLEMKVRCCTVADNKQQQASYSTPVTYRSN